MAKLGEHDLKPYPECKTTTSRWLRDVPSHWGVQSLRTLIKPRAERNCPDLPLLSVAREKGVFVRSLTDLDENHNVIPEDLSNYKVARRGNLVINKMKAWQGSMGIAPCDGIVSPAYFVFDLSISNALFAQAMFRSKPYVAHFAQASDGVRIGQWDLSIPGMREIPVLVPPSDEQAAIVRFLDHANGKIERAIRAKRKLIALLNEQKQAIIHRAVTRGLDSNVKLKPSGIPWLGDVPEHWEVFAIKRLASILNGFAFSSEFYVESGVPLIRIGDLKSTGDVDVMSSAKLPTSYLSSHNYVQIKNGDLLMAMTGATIGKVAYYVHQQPALLNQRVCAFRALDGKVEQDYLLLLLSSRLYQSQVLMACYGGAQPNISDKTLSDFKMPVAPFGMQSSIISHVRSETGSLIQATARTEREIELLREYRTTLTAEVVTGKLDVRAAAAKLPDLSPGTPETATDESAGELELEE